MSSISNTNLFNRVFGISLLVIMILITLLVPYPSTTLRFVIYILSGFSIALIFIKKDSQASGSFNFRNITFSIIGGAAIPILLIMYDPIGEFKVMPESKVNITVFVHGKKGKMDMVIRQQGYVLMDLNGDRQKKPIGAEGDAHFGNLQIGDKVRLAIDFSEPYQPINPDSLYEIDETGKIYLQVALEGIDVIDGMALYDNSGLSGVTVKAGELTATTDPEGSFKIEVPEELQADHYDLWFLKSGFKAKSAVAYPQTGKRVEIIMEKN